MANVRPSSQTKDKETDLATGPGLEQASIDHFLPGWVMPCSTSPILLTLPAARSALEGPSPPQFLPLSPVPTLSPGPHHIHIHLHLCPLSMLPYLPPSPSSTGAILSLRLGTRDTPEAFFLGAEVSEMS